MPASPVHCALLFTLPGIISMLRKSAYVMMHGHLKHLCDDQLAELPVLRMASCLTPCLADGRLEVQYACVMMPAIPQGHLEHPCNILPQGCLCCVPRCVIERGDIKHLLAIPPVLQGGAILVED